VAAATAAWWLSHSTRSNASEQQQQSLPPSPIRGVYTPPPPPPPPRVHEEHVKSVKERQALERDLLPFGAPSYENLLYRGGFIVSYNTRTRNPNWTAEHLSRRHYLTTKAKRDAESNSEGSQGLRVPFKEVCRVLLMMILLQLESSTRLRQANQSYCWWIGSRGEREASSVAA